MHTQAMSTAGLGRLSIVAALALAGCAASLPPVSPESIQAVPVAFKEKTGPWTVAEPADAQSRGSWWMVFDDPILDGLQQRTAKQNSSLQLAGARLKQSQALLLAAEAQRRPVVGATAGVVRQTQPLLDNRAVTQASLAANLAWEVDLFGRLARASEAAALDTDAEAGLVESTRLMVQARVTANYLMLRALDAERTIMADMVSGYRATLAVTEHRLAQGDVAELELERVRSELSATEADALALERQRSLLEHALAALVGETPSGFSLPEATGAIDALALPAIPVDLPAKVLSRRGDVAAAQRRLQAAQLRIGVAQAAWFPDLSLSMSGGTSSSDLGDVLRWSSRAWGLGTLLSLPVLDGGRRDARLAQAQAEFDIAAATYREQVLTAIREVEDEMASLRLLSAQGEAQQRAVAAATRTASLSAARYRNGMIGQLDLLDAQRTLLRSRRQAVQFHAARAVAAVNLVRALGGGWQPSQLQERPPQPAGSTRDG